MIIIGAIGLRFGKWQRLLYGTDYKGQVCGFDGPVKDMKYITYPRTNEDFVLNMQKKSPLEYTFYGVCVSSCPEALSVTCNYDLGLTVTEAEKLSCMTSSSSTSNCVTIRKNCWLQPQVTSSIMFRCIPVYNVSNQQTTTCSYPSSVTSASDPNCILATDSTSGSIERPAKPNVLFDQLNTVQSTWARWFGDLARCWWVILIIAVGFALLLGFLYVQFLKYFTGFMVWTTVILTNLLVWFLTGYMYYKAGLVTLPSSLSFADKLNSATGTNLGSSLANQTSTLYSSIPQDLTEIDASDMASYKPMAYTATGVLIILLCLTIAMRSAINTAVEVIKIGSEALNHNSALLVLPCTNVLTMGLFLVWWVFVAACLQSAGQITTDDVAGDVSKSLAQLQSQYGSNSTQMLAGLSTLNTTFTTVKNMDVMNYLTIYHVFGMLWTTNFISGVTMMIVSGTICSWYFAKPAVDKSGQILEEEAYKGSPLFLYSSIDRTLRYYLGSVALGSFLIAIVQMARLAMVYIQNKLKDQADKNPILKFLMCCIQSCLACLELLVKVVTRNSYIFMQLKGDSFCGSGARVFGMIIKHGSVFAIVNVLGDVLLFMGKCGISALCGWGAFVLLENISQFKKGGENQLSSTWMPVLVTMFFSYCVASGFMDVFNLTIDTILVCYVTDCDEHSGTASRMQANHLDAKGRAFLKEQQAAKAAEGKQAAGEGAAKSASPLAPVVTGAGAALKV
jgi:choline transporter-like protein 2/4/5